MKLAHQIGAARGFTRIELAVVIFIIGILLAMFLPAPTTTGVYATQARCLSNLKQQGAMFQVFAQDHGGKFPFEVMGKDGGTLESVDDGTAANMHMRSIAMPFIGSGQVFVCPTDTRNALTNDVAMLQNKNLSYFVSPDVQSDIISPDSILLTGDRNISNGKSLVNGFVEWQPGQPLRWTPGLHQQRKEKGGMVLLADGHAEYLDQPDRIGTNTFLSRKRQRFALP